MALEPFRIPLTIKCEWAPRCGGETLEEWGARVVPGGSRVECYRVTQKSGLFDALKVKAAFAEHFPDAIADGIARRLGDGVCAGGVDLFTASDVAMDGAHHAVVRAFFGA